MDEQGIKLFLDAVKSKVSKQQSRKGWVVATCPFALYRHEKGVDNNPSFAVKVADHKESTYNCFSCNSKGDLSLMLIDLKELADPKKHPIDYGKALQLIATEEESDHLYIPDYEEQTYEETLTTHPYPEWLLKGLPAALTAPSAYAYLLSRNVPRSLIRFLNVRYDEDKNRCVFPIRDWNYNLVGLHGRSVGKSSLPWYAYKHAEHWNKLIWYGEHWIDPDQPVLMVESVFDMTSVMRVYRNTTCSLLAGLSREKVKRMDGVSDVFTLYDYGKGGDAARTALSKYLECNSMTHLNLSELQDDPGNCSLDEVVKLLKPHLPLDLP